MFKNLCFLINEAISKNEYLFNILELNVNIKTILYIILRQFEQNYLASVNNAVPRKYGLLNETLSAWHRIPPHELLVREASETPQTT